MIQQIRRRMAGYVRFAILGVQPAEGLNLAAANGIILWDMAQVDGVLTACASVGDYRRLSRILRRKNRRRKPGISARGTVGQPAPNAQANEPWWEAVLQRDTNEPSQPVKRRPRWMRRFFALFEPDPPPPPPPPKLPFTRQAAAKLAQDPGQIRRPAAETPKGARKKRSGFWHKRRVRKRKRSAASLSGRQAELRLHAAVREKETLSTRILRRYGIRFWLHRYRKRAGVLVGMAACIALFFLAQGYILDIEIRGNERIPDGMLLASLERSGLRVGLAKSEADVREIAHKVLLEQPDLAWLSVNLLDCRAVIEVAERTDAPDALPEDVPCNLVASQTGQVVGIYAFGGQNAVKVGDSVAAGDLLVSGIFVDFSGGNHYVHAFGEVWAEVAHTLVVEVPLGYQRITPVQPAEHQSWTLPGGTAAQQMPMAVVQSRQAEILGVPLPLTAHRVAAAQVQAETVVRTQEEAAALAQALMDKRIRLLGQGGEVLRTDPHGFVQDGIYRLEVRVVLLQDIAQKQPLEILTAEHAETVR